MSTPKDGFTVLSNFMGLSNFTGLSKFTGLPEYLGQSEYKDSAEGIGLTDYTVQLPFDIHQTSSVTKTLRSFPVSLKEPLSSLQQSESSKGSSHTFEGALVAAVGTLLFRYYSQPLLPLLFSRLPFAEESEKKQLHRSPMLLHINQTTTVERMLSQVAGMQKGEGQALHVPTTPEKFPVEILIVDERNEDPLTIFSSDELQAELTVVALIQKGSEQEESHRLFFLYNAELFSEQTIARMGGHLSTLLYGMTEYPHELLLALPMLTDEEGQWLSTVSKGDPQALPFVPVHCRVEEQAELRPRAIALRYGEELLSYNELNRRANQLARALIHRGANAGDRIIVCVEPSVDISICLLALLKIGASYVPLDPSYPLARITAIIEDTRPSIVVVQRRVFQKIDPQGELLSKETLFVIDNEIEFLTAQEEGNLLRETAPDETAYIYYTSGTTGKPKGVMASQQNLAHYLQVAVDRYRFTNTDSMPAIARFSFSISMFELMLPLVSGGTLVVLDREHVMDLSKMAKTLEEVTFFHAGPTLLKKLLPFIQEKYSDLRSFSHMRHASSGGDMIPPEVLERLKEIFSAAEVYVIYGCSEVSCMGCTYPVPREKKVAKTFVGKPFPGMEVRVLDAANNRMPIGIPGEICFAGGGIVKGYLERPELTAEKFVLIDGIRFYRTGDMGKWSNEGYLEILGRSDFQIKLRGMRIELGEIEYALRQAPGVLDGVVALTETPQGEKTLAAYIVPKESEREHSSKRSTSIRHYLLEHLPDYMVPSIYLELSSLPVNHNMKVDRKALPPIDFASVQHNSALRTPETATEEVLAQLWRELLGMPTVGLEDNFFELGGYSLLAVEFIAGVKTSLGVELDGMEVLREPLEVLGILCDERLGNEPKKLSSSGTSLRENEKIELFYFGKNDELYGIFAPGVSSVKNSVHQGKGVLLCAPVGQEYVRVHFILQKLTRALTSQGISVFRFDYFGCGDSLGKSIEASCSRWQDDIVQAYQELKKRAGASTITAVGVRLGATLLSGSASQLEIEKLVFWDPISHGERYYQELKEGHQRYLRTMRHLRYLRRTKSIPFGEELLGMTYSAQALKELQTLLLVPPLQIPLSWLITSSPEEHKREVQQRQALSVTTLPFDCCWGDISRLGDIIPDVGIAKELERMIVGEA